MNSATYRYDALDAACDVLYYGTLITLVLSTTALISIFALALSDYDQDAGQVIILCEGVAAFTCHVVTTFISWALSRKDAKQMAKQKRT